MSKFPPISVIVPIKNRKDMVPRLLKSLLRLDYPKLEIIIVDDGSTDGTPEVIQNYPVELITLQQSVGSAKARNIGIQRAQNELIALTDSDCVVSPSWLRRLSPYLTKYTIVGGFVQFKDYAEHRLTPLSHLSEVAEIKLNSDINFINTSNMLLRKSIWRLLGGFRSVKLEDVDFSWRALMAGQKIVYLPKGTVFHDNPTHIIQKYKRLKDYGECYSDLMQTYGLKLRYQRPTSKYHTNSTHPLIFLGSLTILSYLNLVCFFISPYLLIPGFTLTFLFSFWKFWAYRTSLGWKFIFLLNIMKFFIVFYSLIYLIRKKTNKNELIQS